MIPEFDIFQTDASGEVRWHGTAKTLTEARERVQELAESSSGEYVILSQQTGQKFVIKSDGGESKHATP